MPIKTYIRDSDGLYVREAPVPRDRKPHPLEPDFIVDPDGTMWLVEPDGERICQGRYPSPEMHARACPWRK